MSEENSKSLQSSLVVTPRDFFYELVKSGFTKRNIDTYPAVQTYLVGLLEHYLDARNLFDEPVDEMGHRQPTTLAEMYLKASGSDYSEKVELLKKLGDRTLYISGFFGDSLQRKIVDIDYYADMGGAAYASLATHTKEDTQAKVYKEFSQKFLDFVEVLTYISHQSFIKSDESILRLYDRYMRTGSEIAREKLVEMGVMTLPLEQNKLARQD